jgi:hypothetical protein
VDESAVENAPHVRIEHDTFLMEQLLLPLADPLEDRLQLFV